MFENYDEIMQKVGESIIQMSNSITDWQKIIVNVERTSEQSIEMDVDYIDYNGENQYFNDFNDFFSETSDIFHKLYQTMTTDTDKHKWNRAKVTLTNDMQLNIKFEWDQELADELERLSQEN
ncbi:MAG: hypothetical protein U9N11_08070 [Campylobacterota bacterium]|nr:hypothetical protein [Campylobacterota bacterium]